MLIKLKSQSTSHYKEIEVTGNETIGIIYEIVSHWFGIEYPSKVENIKLVVYANILTSDLTKLIKDSRITDGSTVHVLQKIPKD